MKKVLYYGFITMVFLLFFLSCSSNQELEFRNVKWGDTREQVQEAEGSRGEQNDLYFPHSLTYTVPLFGEDARLSYDFDDVYGLRRIDYTLEFKTEEEAISYGESMKGILEEKYGKPKKLSELEYLWVIKDSRILARIYELDGSLSFFVGISYSRIMEEEPIRDV